MDELAHFFGHLFDSSSWPPRWHCGVWTDFHGWVYIISNLLIWSAYFAIPIVIVKFVVQKANTQFTKLYFLFAAFILACGLTHLLDAVAFWVPMYRFNALVLFVTAIISWITVYNLIKLMPVAFSLKTQKEFEFEIEQKNHAENEVRKLNTQLEDMVASRTAEIVNYKYALDESAIVAITDQKGIIQHVNDNFCKISKYTREELLGRDHRIINSEYHPKEYIRDLWVTIANGKIWKGELKNKAKDGTIYWVDTTIVPFLNDEGKPYQYMAIRADITKRKESEEREQKLKDELSRSEVRFRSMVHNIADIITLVDEEGKIKYESSSIKQVLGYDEKELLGKSIFELMHPDDIDFIATEFAKNTQDDGNGPLVEFRYLNKEGKYIYMEAQGSNQINNPHIRAVVVNSRDITKRKEAEKERELLIEELTRNNKDLQQFSYITSHNLRAPIANLLGLVEAYNRDNPADEFNKVVIDGVATATNQINNTLHDLIEVVTIRGNTGINRELLKFDVEFSKILNSVINLVNQSGAHITVDFENAPEISYNKTYLESILLNLITNAIKYKSPKRPLQVKVRTYINGNKTVLEFEDNGLGIDLNRYSDRLFGLYQRFHGNHDSKGLGLYIVNSQVTAMGGKIAVESTPDVGTKFIINLN